MYFCQIVTIFRINSKQKTTTFFGRQNQNKIPLRDE